MATPASTTRATAFVTGASYGIGAAAAVALARDGFNLVLSAIRVENLSATCSQLAAMGAQAFPVALDIRSSAGIRAAMAAAVDAFGSVDVLVNNAGVTQRRRVLEITEAEWNTIMETNLTGTFFMSQQMGRHLIESRRPGCIINMASTHGLVGMAERAAYGISKAAIIHMTRMLAVEWAEHRIRVNAIAPGRVESGSPQRAATAADPKRLEAALKRIPLGRFASVEDVAQAIAYLARPEASYITGHTLVLDGGVTVQ